MIEAEIHKVNTLISQNKLSDAILHLGELFQSFIPAPDKIDVLILMGELYVQLNDLESADKSFTNAYKLQQKQPGDDDERIFNEALIGFNLGAVKTELHKTKEALELFKDASALLDKIHMSDPIITEQKAMCQHEISGRYLELKDYYLTKKHAKIALELYAEILDLDQVRYTQPMANCNVIIAESFDNESDLNTAFIYYKKAVELYEKLSLSDQKIAQPIMAAIYNNMAVTQKQLGFHGKSAEHYQKTLDIYKELSQENPEEYEPFLAGTFNSIGVLFTDLNYRKKGIKYYEDALKLYQKLAYDEPELYTHYVATTTHNLGVIYDEMNEYDSAYSYYEKALDIRRELAKKEPIAFNMDTSVTILNIVTMYHSRLESEKDLKYREPALELLQEAESRLMLAESEKPVIKSMKNDLEYFKEFFEEIDLKTLLGD